MYTLLYLYIYICVYASLFLNKLWLNRVLAHYRLVKTTPGLGTVFTRSIVAFLLATATLQKSMSSGCRKGVPQNEHIQKGL